MITTHTHQSLAQNNAETTRLCPPCVFCVREALPQTCLGGFHLPDLNPAESEKMKQNKKVKQGVLESEEERGVLSRIRLFLGVSQAPCRRLTVMDGPPTLKQWNTH